jgi:hypothetical protein
MRLRRGASGAGRVRRQWGCHLYFARRVTFLSCADMTTFRREGPPTRFRNHGILCRPKLIRQRCEPLKGLGSTIRSGCNGMKKPAVASAIALALAGSPATAEAQAVWWWCPAAAQQDAEGEHQVRSRGRCGRACCLSAFCPPPCSPRSPEAMSRAQFVRRRVPIWLACFSPRFCSGFCPGCTKARSVWQGSSKSSCSFLYLLSRVSCRVRGSANGWSAINRYFQ